jgi:hypothetical protein
VIADNGILAQAIEASIDSLGQQVPQISSAADKLASADFKSDLDLIRREFAELRELIDSTRQIANSIKSPVSFNSSSVVYLKPPVTGLHPSLVLTGSIYVKTEQENVPLVYIYNESDASSYLSLSLFKGRPQLRLKLSSGEPSTVLSVNKRIDNDRWHKIAFERVGRHLKLSVANDKEEKSDVATISSALFNVDQRGAKIALGQVPLSQAPADIKSLFQQNNQFKGVMDSFILNNQKQGECFFFFLNFVR